MILFFESPKSQDRSREISHGAPLGVGEAVASRARSRNRIPVRRSVEDRTTPFEQPTSEEPCGNKGGRLYGKTGFNRNTGIDFRLKNSIPFYRIEPDSMFRIIGNPQCPKKSPYWKRKQTRQSDLSDLSGPWLCEEDPTFFVRNNFSLNFL